MENKDMKERDFHHGEGHSVPFFIKLAWTVLLTWCVIYFVKYGIPDLKMWLK